MRVERPLPLGRRPLVSVVVPHYNYGSFLPVSVHSALDQRGVDVEVIVVDDASNDGSVAVARQLTSDDSRVTLIEHEHNMRHIRTYNDGLSRATGDYVVLLSADDALTTDSLTRSIALLESNDDVGLVYGRVVWFDGELPPVGQSRVWWQIWTGEEWIRRIAGRGRNAIANPEVVMRKSVYDDIGGYDPDFPHAGDMFMWLQAAARSGVGFVGGVPQAFYRNHGANMHATEFGGLLDDMRQVRDVYARFFAQDGAELVSVAELLQLSMESVAREAILRGVLLSATTGCEDPFVEMRLFAVETCPSIVDSWVWRWSNTLRHDGAVTRRFIGSVERARWKVRSRRTDLLGL